MMLHVKLLSLMKITLSNLKNWKNNYFYFGPNSVLYSCELYFRKLLKFINSLSSKIMKRPFCVEAIKLKLLNFMSTKKYYSNFWGVFEKHIFELIIQTVSDNFLTSINKINFFGISYAYHEDKRKIILWLNYYWFWLLL